MYRENPLPQSMRQRLSLLVRYRDWAGQEEESLS